jgi:hypothetical protein
MSSMSDVTTLPDGRPVLHWLALAVGLTFVDAIATAVWLEWGVADEANPLLAGLVDVIGAVPAMAVRAGVGVLLLLLLGLLSRRSRLARIALPLVTLVLLAVALWHALGGLTLV